MQLLDLSFLCCTYKSNMFDFPSPPSVSAAWLAPHRPACAGRPGAAPALHCRRWPFPSWTPLKTHVPGRTDTWDSVSSLEMATSHCFCSSFLY